LGGQLTALYPEKYVYDMPGFPKVLAKDLAREMAVQGTQFKPDLCLGETAEELEELSEVFIIHTSSGKRLPTRTIVIAAGAGAFSPTRIGVSREEEFEGRGLYYGVRSTAEFGGKRLAIVGGGDSAFDWALHLSPIAGNLKLIHRRDQFRAHEDTVAKVRELPVEFKLWSIVSELHGNGHLRAVTVENVQTKERETFELDALIVNVGYKSSLGPIKNWGLSLEKSQIMVDGRMMTNRAGIFAVGDVCTYANKLKLIATGVGEAATAVCVAKTLIDPSSKLFPGHSSDLDL
jgi:thioredoxin reductase (NADPH)